MGQECRRNSFINADAKDRHSSEVLIKNKTPFISILTDPTTGGVSASFAMLGDIIIAEQNATIDLQVVELLKKIKEKLPQNFQKSEYLIEKGMIDIVVHRKDLNKKIMNILEFLIIFISDKSKKILKRLELLHPKKIDLSLKRLIKLLRKLDNPHEKLSPIIHIAGTNGKGSVTSYLRSIFEKNNLSVHTYTSPHLIRFNERIRVKLQINKQSISLRIT